MPSMQTDAAGGDSRWTNAGSFCEGLLGTDRRTRLRVGVAVAVALVAAGGFSLEASGTAPPAGPPSGDGSALPSATSPATPPTAPPGHDDDLDRGRPPLLREGSHLVGLKGTMDRGETQGSWRFTIENQDPNAPRYELTMLPCALLGEMERIVEAARGQRVVFEATGQVFVYRGRNYFLASHAPQLTGYNAPPAGAPAVDEPVPSPGRGGDTADDIARQLEQAVGPLARSTASADLPEAQSASPAREGSAVLARRGRLRRHRTGAWLFVFDADAEGLADPPMILLPCLLLESMEKYARTAPKNAPLLVSGHVHVYGRRTYLLPTVYRTPRERTLLTP